VRRRASLRGKGLALAQSPSGTVTASGRTGMYAMKVLSLQVESDRDRDSDTTRKIVAGNQTVPWPSESSDSRTPTRSTAATGTSRARSPTLSQTPSPSRSPRRRRRGPGAGPGPGPIFQVSRAHSDRLVRSLRAGLRLAPAARPACQLRRNVPKKKNCTSPASGSGPAPGPSPRESPAHCGQWHSPRLAVAGHFQVRVFKVESHPGRCSTIKAPSA
jgi:hypothetical protein